LPSGFFLIEFSILKVNITASVKTGSIIFPFTRTGFSAKINPREASFSIMLNIAEGTSRFSNKDRKNLFVIARGSTFESAGILKYLYEIKAIEEMVFKTHTDNLEEISKMLFSLIQHLDKN
jgi:four helix bundle protein